MIAMLPMRDAIRIHFIPLSPSHSGRAHFFTSGCDNATTTSDLRQKKWSARINKLWRMGWEWSEWHMRMSGSRANNSVATLHAIANNFPEKWTTWMREKRKAATGIPILPRLSEKKTHREMRILPSTSLLKRCSYKLLWFYWNSKFKKPQNQIFHFCCFSLQLAELGSRGWCKWDHP